MTPRKEHFPRPSFDHHAEAMQDPTIGKLDRLEGRPWIKEFDAKYRAAALAPTPKPIPAPRAEDPASYMNRPSRQKSLMVVLIVGPLTLLALVGWMFFGWVVSR